MQGKTRKGSRTADSFIAKEMAAATVLAESERNLKALCTVQEKMFNIILPGLPAFANVADIKKFCVSFLESQPPQGWERKKIFKVIDSVSSPSEVVHKCERTPASTSYRRLITKEEYFSLSASFFLFRKTLPSSGPDIRAYMTKLGTPKSPDTAFLDFCKVEIPKIFKEGWDEGFEERVERVVVGTKSFYEKMVPGDTARDFIKENHTREEFMQLCRDGSYPLCNKRRVSVVFAKGKARIVTIASAYQYCLSPISGLIYDQLSKKEWLLRGDAKAASFKQFQRVSGEVFVSGDYESATDNFNLIHSQTILGEVLKTMKNTPMAIRIRALESLDAEIVYKNFRVHQESGQLMGDKLSFPLLCLTNYLAFAYAMRPFCSKGKGLPPVKINGDDIVFRCTKAMADRWFDVVAKSGLVVSRGKTMVHDKYFSLNSTFFTATPSGCRLIPCIRSEPIFVPNPDAAMFLNGRLNACNVGFKGKKKHTLLRLFLRQNVGYLWKSQVSLRRGHNVLVPSYIQRDLGLMEREETYLSLGPSYDKFSESKKDSIDGYRRVVLSSRRLVKAAVRARDSVREAFVQKAWADDDTNDVENAKTRGPIRVQNARKARTGVSVVSQTGFNLLQKFGGSSKGALGALGRFTTVDAWDHLNRRSGFGQPFGAKKDFVAEEEVGGIRNGQAFVKATVRRELPK